MKLRHGTAVLMAVATLAVGLVPTLATPPAGAVEPPVTVLGPLVTLKAEDPTPAGGATANLTTARNEFESFQVAVRADADGIGSLRANLTGDLVSTTGGTLPAPALSVYREEYYQVSADHLSDGESTVGHWPDALVPQVDPIYHQLRTAFRRPVPAGGRVVLWVDVLTPPGQAPGTYTGTLRIKDGAAVVGNVRLNVTVRDMTLPSTSSLDSVFLTEPTKLCEVHTGSGTCNGDVAEANRLSAIYERMALENRITIATPWQVDRGAALSGPMQTSWRQQVLPILNGTPAPTSVGSPIRLPGARATNLVLWHYCKGPCLDAWKAQATADGFADRLHYYTCDEPNQSTTNWAACADNHAVAQSRGMRELVTTPLPYATTSGARSWIDDMVVLARMMDGRNGTFAGNQRPTYDAWTAEAGDGQQNDVWIYNSCEAAACNDPGDPGWDDPFYNGWAGYGIDQPASQARAMPWTAFVYDATGELYWGVDFRLGQAWNSCGAGGTDCLYESGMNGDATLFYPGRGCAPGVAPGCIGGTKDIPVESIRLKRIRDGREDYEYLTLAAANPDTAGLARSTALSLLGGDLDAAAFSTTFSQAALDQARDTLGDAIEHPLANPVFRPDGEVRVSSGAFRGNDVYNTTGAGQTVRVALAAGASRTFTIRVGNDGDTADDWSFAEAASGTGGLSRTWTRNGTDVTARVAAGTLSALDVPPGATRSLDLTVQVGPDAAPGQVAIWALHSVHNPLADGIRDVVRVRVDVVGAAARPTLSTH